MLKQTSVLFRRICLLSCAFMTLPLLAIADGQHNDKTCYAETAGGIEISSPCSSRKTTCNDDYTCSIDGIAGEMRDGIQKAKEELADMQGNDGSQGPDGTSNENALVEQDATTRKKGSGLATGKRQHKPLTTTKTPAAAGDYNSSRSNNTNGIVDPDQDDDDDSGDVSAAKATDYNSSRSNRSTRATDYNSSRPNKRERTDGNALEADESEEETDKESDKGDE